MLHMQRNQLFLKAKVLISGHLPKFYAKRAFKFL